MSNGQLKALAERIERLMDERDGIQSDIRDIYAEAKSNGFVPKVLRKAITRKRMDAGKRDEEDAILELYEGALSPTMRKAAAMAKEGATSRQIEAETGMDHATVARSVALNKKSATPAETGSATRSGDGLSDALSPVGDIPAGQDACSTGETTETVEVGAVGSDSDRVARPSLTPLSAEAEKARRPPPPVAFLEAIHDDAGLTTFGQEVARVAPPELGAVAEPSEAQRVATNDDPGPIPEFLRRTPRQSASSRGGSVAEDGAQ